MVSQFLSFRPTVFHKKLNTREWSNCMVKVSRVIRLFALHFVRSDQQHQISSCDFVYFHHLFVRLPPPPLLRSSTTETHHREVEVPFPFSSSLINPYMQAIHPKSTCILKITIWSSSVELAHIQPWSLAGPLQIPFIASALLPPPFYSLTAATVVVSWRLDRDQRWPWSWLMTIHLLWILC